MRQKYRIYALGIPQGLEERISEIHAEAILKADTQDVPDHTEGLKVLSKADVEHPKLIKKLRK
jgi:hypothetical protein